MHPTDLPGRPLTLPATDRHSIVIVTGQAPRHRRFALRIQEEFPGLVEAWFEIEEPVVTEATSLRSKLGELKRSIKGRTPSPAEIEARVFEGDMRRLEQIPALKPAVLAPSAISSPEFVEQIRRIDPYFFLTLGGALYPKALLEAVRGVAINQHAGHSPQFKGTCTTEWALYHRNLGCVSNTVHITATGADNGPVLRRSHPSLTSNDDFPTIFARVVAVGTEMLIESVHEIIAGKEITVFDQDQSVGRTYLGTDLTPDITDAIQADLAGGLVGRELKRLRSF